MKPWQKFDKDEKKRSITGLALITQLGISFAVTIGGCLFLGKLLDDWLNTSPWFLLIFVVLGVAAAFRNLFHFTKM